MQFADRKLASCSGRGATSTIARFVVSLGLCMVSLIYGHDLVYRMLRSGSDHHDAASAARLFEMHAYVSGLRTGAVYVAVAGVVLFVLARARECSHRSATVRHGGRWSPAVWLPLAFLVMELVERIPMHEGLPPFDIVVVGMVLQVACGLLAGVIVSAVIRGADRMARVVATLFTPRAARGQRVPCERSTPRLDTRIACGICMSVLWWRGPPGLSLP